MMVNYFVVQENLKGERTDKFLFQATADLVMSGEEVEHKNKMYQVQHLVVEPNLVKAICYDLKRKPNGKTNTEEYGSTDHDAEHECPKC
jgi:hypothetical protein